MAARIVWTGAGSAMATILDAGVRDSVFPGAVALIGTRDDVLVEWAAGHLDWGRSPPPNDSAANRAP